ncbi:replication initiator protein [Microviridae sp.]|nr:replication initiator protein [Microviridae sp.]
MGCRIEHKRSWAIRALHEAKQHERSAFVTLTYNNQNLPPDLGLHVDHWQNFAKRVRNRFGKFRFFGCGEYGGESKRPHWHFLAYGLDWSHDRETHTLRGQHPTYISESLAEAWPYGYHEIGSITYASTQYVASYTTKKLGGEKKEREYYRWDPNTRNSWSVRPEFGLMSRRPGLGIDWLKKFWKDVYPSDEVIIEGRKYRPPSYYDAWMEQNHPEVMIPVKKKRKEMAMQEPLGQSRFRQTVAKETIQRAVNNLFTEKEI